MESAGHGASENKLAAAAACSRVVLNTISAACRIWSRLIVVDVLLLLVDIYDILKHTCVDSF